MSESPSSSRGRILAIAAVVVAVLIGGGLILALSGRDARRSNENAPDAKTLSARLGKPVSPAALALLDQTVMPDGTGLPPGQGTAERGRAIYEAQCAFCHGPQGRGGVADQIPALTGGVGSLSSSKPIRTLNSFWPYAPPAFDYIRRAMPPAAPQSLTNDEVYAVLAYLLSVDGIVPSTAPLTRQSLAAVRMPNRNGFQDMR